MAHIKKEYQMISPHELVRAEEHADTFFAPEQVEHEGTIDSYKTHDRIKPVYCIERSISEESKFAVIDGWKYVEFARQAGIEKIYVCILTVENNNDLLSVMMQLQRSNHDSYKALFKMIQQLWPIHYKGQGYRSDLSEKELEEQTEVVDGKKLNIYERIGRELNLSGNKVKFIRKVGVVNNLHFERIEVSRFTLYAAYLECLKEENGKLPEVPSVQAPDYFSNNTGAPEFSSPTTTQDEITKPENATEASPESESLSANTSDAESEFIVVRGKCKCCGQITEIEIDKNLLQ